MCDFAIRNLSGQGRPLDYYGNRPGEVRSGRQGSGVISVIIPTYNRALFIERSIRSVAEQTRACGELIVVDDGSTDDTRLRVAACAAQTDIPVRYIHQDNQGAAAARNTGIKAARGDLLAFLDSDDRFVPEKLARQFEAMRDEPQYLVSHTRETWYRHGRILRQKKKHQPPYGEIFKACLKMCMVGMSTVMVRKELFDRYGMFDESLPCCEDYDFWLRVSAHEKFLLLDRPLTLKDGGRRDQLSAIYRLGMDQYRIRSLVLLLDRTPLAAWQYELAVAELERKCEIYGNGCIKHGRLAAGRACLDLPLKYRLAAAAAGTSGAAGCAYVRPDE